jgi:hypothetical protein
MTIEELIDLTQQELTVGCRLPRLLDPLEIRRIIEKRAEKYFYKNYQYAVQKAYYYLHKNVFTIDEYTRYGYLTLPCEIQNVVWIFPTDDKSLYELGINAPNLSVNFGVTNQPYVSSYLTTIGELGTYKTIMDGFSDMLNQLTKTTFKYDFNENNNRLNFLTSMDKVSSFILEVYARVEKECLYDDELFQRYVTALCKIQISNLLGLYNFNLPGGVQYNSDKFETQADKEMEKVMEEIKSIPNSNFIRMVRR